MKIKSDKPFINIWFGHFFEPAYNDERFVNEALKEISELGFDNVELDSKSWQDFFDRYEGGEASQYIKMLEFMLSKIKEYGLCHNFLAIYSNGDNLYPHIRFSPPVLGEAVISHDGKEIRCYKYWSIKAQEVMVMHVKGLFELYGDNHSSFYVNGEKRIPVCTMWDPLIQPSFDVEGRKRYVEWLEKKYEYNILELNKAYRSNFESFEELNPQDYWFELRYGHDFLLTGKDYLEKSPALLLRVDNLKWKIEETTLFFRTMKRKYMDLNRQFFLSPNLSQWNIFFNIADTPYSEYWDRAKRGIDPYKIAPYVDNCSFYSTPVSVYGDPEPYTVSCEHSIMRAVNSERDLIGGIFLGRFLFKDIYRFVTPPEVIGTVIGSGAKGINFYGYCGFDDGGIIHKLDKSFKESVKRGIEWAKTVIPLIQGKRRKEVAILFPSAMAAFEELTVEGNPERRMDLLGWYKAVCDTGYMADVLHADQIELGILNKYHTLILPSDDCYFIDRNLTAEKCIAEWVDNGGRLIHGPGNQVAKFIFDIVECETVKDCFFYYEGQIPESLCYSYYEGGRVIAPYIGDKKGCITEYRYGQGSIFSFGFNYGYAYTAQQISPVPAKHGNNEYYPVTLSSFDPFKDILKEYRPPAVKYANNIETAVFDSGIIIINHSSYIYNISDIKGQKYFQYNMGNDELMPHSCVFIKTCCL